MVTLPVIITFILLSVRCLNLNPEIIINGFKNYTMLHTGNINIMITAAHGGYQNPEDIEERKSDSLGNLKGDFNTKPLALAIKDELKILFRQKKNIKVSPFLVYNDLVRKRMDPNRNSSEACQNTKDDCFIAYNQFHYFIEKYFQNDFMINGKEQYEQGLLIDIHGQSHPEKWIELGYLLSRNDLNTDYLLGDSTGKSSISRMQELSDYTFEDIIRGTQSLGDIFENKFYLKTVPSRLNKSLKPGENYYSGGFIIKTHGSRNYPKHRVNAIQIELPYYLRRSSAYKKTGLIIAEAVYDFYNANRMHLKTN